MILSIGLPDLLPADEQSSKLIVGRTETVCLPEWGIKLEAKIDTGAYRSSLHVSKIELVEGNPRMVRFQTTDHNGILHTIQAPVEAYVKTKSSSGHIEKRPVIRVRLCLAGKERKATVSLTNRSDMRFPMLIGRRALKGHFLVDPALEHSHANTCCQ